MQQTLGFCFGSGSAAILLHTDLIQNECQRGDGGQEGTQDRCDQGVLAGQLAEAIQLLGGQNGAFNDAALDGQGLQLVLLGELADDASGGDGIASGNGHCGSTVQNLVEIVTNILGSETSQSVLDNGVLNASLTEQLTQRVVLCNGDTLVVNKDDGSSLLDLTGQLLDDGLLAIKNLCVGHEMSPPK